MYSSIVVFLRVFEEIIKFEAHSHGVFNFSKKDSANRHALKTRFTLRVLCFSLKENFQAKVCIGITLFQNYVYSLQPASLQKV